MISEIDVRDWDRAEYLIGKMPIANEETYLSYALQWEDFLFLRDLIEAQRRAAKKVPWLQRVFGG